MNTRKPTAAAIPERSPPQATTRGKTRKSKHALNATKNATAKPVTQPQSKQDRILAMLRGKGTTVAAVMKATGWQKHSVHGFFAGVVRKKLQLKLVSEKVGDKHIYRIGGGAPSKADRTLSKRRRSV